MRITIETDDREGINVTRDGQEDFTTSPSPKASDAIDGGGAHTLAASPFS